MLSPRLSDPGRLAALAATEMTQRVPEDTFDRLTALVQRCLRVPVALISMVDAERQVFKSQQGLAEPWCTLGETPLSHSFCQHVVVRDAPLVVEDARLDPLVRDNLAIPDLGVVAYLGVPLRTPDGHVLGSLCAIEGQPRAWTGSDLETMEALAEATMAEIAARWRLASERQDLWAAVEQGRALVRALFDDERPRALVRDGWVADANAALLDRLGRTREAVVGQRLRDALALSSDDAERLADALINANLGEPSCIPTPAGALRLVPVPGARATLAEIGAG